MQLAGNFSARVESMTTVEWLALLNCNLKVLELQSNMLTGYLPRDVTLLTRLSTFNVGYNGLVGR